MLFIYNIICVEFLIKLFLFLFYIVFNPTISFNTIYKRIINNISNVINRILFFLFFNNLKIG